MYIAIAREVMAIGARNMNKHGNIIIIKYEYIDSQTYKLSQYICMYGHWLVEYQGRLVLTLSG